MNPSLALENDNDLSTGLGNVIDPAAQYARVLPKFAFQRGGKDSYLKAQTIQEKSIFQ